MRLLARLRRRDGAFQWGLFQDTANPDRLVETFLVESWAEHLRQHGRRTAADRDIEESAKAFHDGPEPPRISHFLSV